MDASIDTLLHRFTSLPVDRSKVAPAPNKPCSCLPSLTALGTRTSATTRYTSMTSARTASASCGRSMSPTRASSTSPLTPSGTFRVKACRSIYGSCSSTANPAYRLAIAQSLKQLREHVAYARFTPVLWALLEDLASRAAFRQPLLDIWFD
jgi:hypothetical protein